MIKIVWSINDINKYQTGSLPDDAVKIETPQSVDELMKKAVPIAAILLPCNNGRGKLYCRDAIRTVCRFEAESGRKRYGKSGRHDESCD